MRLAILGARGIPAAYGGLETFAEQLSVRLVARGHEITVFCESRENPSEQYKGVKLQYVPVRHLGPLSTVLYGAESVNNACPEQVKNFGLDPGSYYLVACRFEPENHIKEIIEGFLGSKTQARLVLAGDDTR